MREISGDGPAAAQRGRNDAERLLRWYLMSRRDLPWRRTRDPWAIWVSEVMLQQTRVQHVVAYFEPFLARFPDPAALAATPVDEALAHWSGLGYYRRLRLLHRAAAALVAAGGGIPTELAALRALPGVGDYTAAAVASIAFGVAEPALDGNVVRLLCRWLACGDDPRRRAVRARLREAARALLVAASAGDSNQALMELGGRVCTPRAPRCPECPLAASCAARAAGNPEVFPRATRRGATQRVTLVMVVVEDAGRVLLFRRPAGASLLAGTWELPWVEAGVGDPAGALARRYGGSFELGAEHGRVRHAITTRRLAVTVRASRFLAGGVGEGREAAWVRREEVGALPVSSLVHKALAAGRPEEAGERATAAAAARRTRGRAGDATGRRRRG